jgi:GAF domain-containing protein
MTGKCRHGSKEGNLLSKSIRDGSSIKLIPCSRGNRPVRSRRSGKGYGGKRLFIDVTITRQEDTPSYRSLWAQDWYIRKGPVSADKSLSKALEGKPVAVLEATKDERIQYREQAKKEGIVSILSVPMMLREDTIGVIRVYTSEPYHFTMDDMFFVGAVANLGAIALENARLYEASQKDYETFRRDMLGWASDFFRSRTVSIPMAPPLTINGRV